jgi:signal transduction histidine kinase/ActR/RegA family two-component response regulator
MKLLPYWQGLISLPIILTDQLHGLFRHRIEFSSVHVISYLEFERGPWYLLNLGATYVQILLGIVLIARMSVGKNNLNRKQTRIILAGVNTPFLGNLAYIFGLYPTQHYDPTPALLGVAGIALAGSVFRWALFDLAPIARDLVVEQLPMPVIVASEADQIIDMNEAARKLFRASDLRMLGLKANKVIAERGRWEDTWFLADQKTYKLLRYPVTDAVGDQVGSVYQFNDMTDTLAYERELSSAKEYAESASAAKSRFIANVSHEIRTPLNGVIGISELMQSTEMSAEQRNYVQAIMGCSRTLLQIVNDILDLSKLEAGKFELETKDTDLQLLIRDVLRAHEATATSRGLKFEYKIDPLLPQFVNTDPSKLRQTLNNLVSNAVKFTERGGVNVSVMRDGSMTEIVVQDSGIGIPLDKQDRIFEPFQQADASNSRIYGGTGLGLAIVKQTVDLFDGTLDMKSIPGEGTTITVRLPLEVVKGRSEQREEIPNLRGVHVLLVEDNAINAMVVQKLLERSGCSVDHARDGYQAVEMVETAQYEIVLLDLQMPGLDGYETYRRVRSLADVPIVALTANANYDDRMRCMRLGMVDFLTKPVAPMDLYRVIDEHRKLPATSSAVPS